MAAVGLQVESCAGLNFDSPSSQLRGEHYHCGVSYPLPQPVNAGYGSEYGSAVMPVHEWYPGVEVVQAMPDSWGATPVNIVHEMGPGVRPVYFEGGLPAHLDPAAVYRQHAEQAYAYAAAQALQSTQLQVEQQAAHTAVMLLTIL
jgi:hypothetical protein